MNGMIELEMTQFDTTSFFCIRLTFLFSLVGIFCSFLVFVSCNTQPSVIKKFIYGVLCSLALCTSSQLDSFCDLCS